MSSRSEGILSFFLIALLLGGVVLLSKRSTISSNAYEPPRNQYSQSANIRVIEEPPRYHNEETRSIKYNDDGLPIEIKITRDYAIT